MKHDERQRHATTFCSAGCSWMVIVMASPAACAGASFAINRLSAACEDKIRLSPHRASPTKIQPLVELASFPPWIRIPEKYGTSRINGSIRPSRGDLLMRTLYVPDGIA